jgi:hypothetical protein
VALVLRSSIVGREKIVAPVMDTICRGVLTMYRSSRPFLYIINISSMVYSRKLCCGVSLGC